MNDADSGLLVGILCVGLVLSMLAPPLLRLWSKEPVDRNEPSFAASEGGVAPANPAAEKKPPGRVAGIVVIIVGGLVALIGLGCGITANPRDSAFQQAVVALWLLSGVVGLVIVAIGIAIIVIEQAILSRPH